MAKELADPSPFLNDLVEEFIRPTANVLLSVVREMLGPKATDEHIGRCQISVIGQCFHYAIARPIVSRLAAVDLADAAIVDELTDHITCFSIAGIQAVRHSIITHTTPSPWLK